MQDLQRHFGPAAAQSQIEGRHISPTSPNLFVIGVQKSATTWLHMRLANHPEVFMSATKELQFFCHANWEGRIGRYLSAFSSGGDARYRGESSPQYFWWHVDRASGAIPRRIREAFGTRLNFVVCFRHPVQRAVSAYFHHYRQGRFRGDEPFLSACEQFGVCPMGHYRRNLEPWFETFPKERFTFMIFEDMVQRPVAVLGEIAEKLGLSEFDSRDALTASPENIGFSLRADATGIHIDPDSEAKLNARLKKGRLAKVRKDRVAPLIPPECIAELERRFRPDIEFLEEVLLQRRLGWLEPKPLSYYAS